MSPVLALRKKKNLKQIEVAKACGLTRQAMFKLENGRVAIPTVDTVRKLAGVFNVKPEKLMFDYLKHSLQL